VPTKTYLPTAIVVIVLIFLGVIIMQAYVPIRAGHRGVVLRFGAAEKAVLTPGLHFIVPFVETVHSMPVAIQQQTFREEAASKDLQTVTTHVAVNFSVDPTYCSWVYRHIGNINALVVNIITPAVNNIAKAVTAHYNAQDLVIERDKVRDRIDQQITSTLAPYHLTVEAVNITNFAFSPEYSQAIENKQVAQQKALQATYVLQRIKVNAQQMVVQAQARAQAEITLAKADQTAQALRGKTLTPELLMLAAVRKWDGRLPRYAGAGAFPVVPLKGLGSPPAVKPKAAH
jgi:regulator of protease activity HflC (stomatin/prohibitin superfamily)